MDIDLHVIIETLGGIILAGLTWFLKTLGTRVGKVENDLQDYKTNVGVGNTKLETLHSMIEHHMGHEETQLESLSEQFHDLNVKLATVLTKLEAVGSAANTEYARVATNEKEAAEWRLRVVKLETRMERVENGSK